MPIVVVVAHRDGCAPRLRTRVAAILATLAEMAGDGERGAPTSAGPGRSHQAIDRAVDRLYRAKGFASEREGVEHLFMIYEKMRMLLAAVMEAKPNRRRTKGKPGGAVR